MNVAGFYSESIANGDGVRAVLYVSGCPHKCPMCHNEETQEATYGELFTKELKDSYIRDIKENTILKGITLSGGEPLWENNVEEVLSFTKEVLSVRPDLDVWTYTGYKYEHLLKRDCSFTQELLSITDVLIDGKYIHAQRDEELLFKGSKNQRLILTKESSLNNIKLWQQPKSFLKLFR